MADTRQSAAVYMKTFQFIFAGITIDVEALMNSVNHYVSSVKDVQKILQLKSNTQLGKTRISLRHVIANSARTVSVGAHGGTHTIQSFCDSVRFPNSMTNLIKLRCYLLAAQEHCFEYRKYTERLVSSDIATLINDNCVIFPDINTISQAIQSLTIYKVGITCVSTQCVSTQSLSTQHRSNSHRSNSYHRRRPSKN